MLPLKALVAGITTSKVSGASPESEHIIVISLSPRSPLLLRRADTAASFKHIANAISDELKEPSLSRIEEDAEDAHGDSALPDFWAEVHEEARAMMAQQLEAEMVAAREEGLLAAKQELEVTPLLSSLHQMPISAVSV